MSDDARNYEWISVPELIRRTGGGISDNLVYRLCREGKLEAIRVSERKWLVRADAWDVLHQKQRGTHDDARRDPA